MIQHLASSICLYTAVEREIPMEDEIPIDDSTSSQSPEIGSSSVRKTVFFLIGFIVSLVIGKGFEVATSKETYKELKEVQNTWRTSLEEYSPISLATGYWDDVQIVFGGGPLYWVPFEEECRLFNYVSQIRCGFPTHIGEAEVAKCRKRVDHAKANFAAKCNEWVTQQSTVKRHESNTQPNPRGGLKNAFLSPVFALVRTWSRLTQDGGWSYLWAFVQLFLGFIGFMLVFSLFSDSRHETRYFPESVPGWLLIVPPGVIVMASLIAFPLKYVMLGGLTAFGWFTGLAGACCAATGIAGIAFTSLRNIPSLKRWGEN